MQAVRLARYHTRRTHLVRFCGAYHGWWGDVQPGIGNPLPARETYTLQATCPSDSLRVLRTRRDIACVLVNPLQALHPNAGAPSDAALVDSARARAFRQARPTPTGCKRLRAVCTEREHRADLRRSVRRLPPRAAAARRSISACAPISSPTAKTLGGGLPIGVVCGRKRSDEAVSATTARPTSALPAAPSTRIPTSWRRCTSSCVISRRREAAALYRDLDRTWNERAQRLNQRLRARGAAGAGRQHVLDLDRLLHAAVALQLDAAILSARRRAGAELGRHRPPDLQPQLHRRRLRRRSRTASSPPPRPWSRTAGGGTIRR